MKHYFKLIFFLTFFSISTKAYTQSAFWSFDNNNDEISIPIQCDGQFDEARGGVYLPTPDELFEQGELFLLEKGDMKKNSAYCLLSAAVQGHVEAQYRIAQMYNKGVVFPQNDLASYKWAFVAALNGHKEAEQMALTLEQLLTTNDIELATNSVKGMLPEITGTKKGVLAEVEGVLNERKAYLEEVNKEIDDMLGIKYKKPEVKQESDGSTDKHFDESDRMN